MGRYAKLQNLTAAERAKIVRLYQNENLSVGMLAKRFALVPENIRRVLHAEGVAVRRRAYGEDAK
jgi:transposase-like protein